MHKQFCILGEQVGEKQTKFSLIKDNETFKRVVTIMPSLEGKSLNFEHSTKV